MCAVPDAHEVIEALAWMHGSDPAGTAPVEVRGILDMRREVDGLWRVLMERIG